jgi:hypothetical protein
MRISRALAVAAAVLAPAGLVVVQAGPAAADWHPCGAITMNPACDPARSPAAPPSQPHFPYTSMTTASVSTASMTQPAVQLPSDGTCQGQLAAECTTQAEPASAAAPAASDTAPAPAASSTLLHGLLPVASDRSVASSANHNKGLPMAPVAAAGTVLAGFGALTWLRRKRHSN